MDKSQCSTPVSLLESQVSQELLLIFLRLTERLETKTKKMARKQETNNKGLCQGAKKRKAREWNCHIRAFFLMRKLQHLPKYGPLVPRESFKMPRKKKVFPRIHPELGIHWYYTHLSLTNTPIYHHPRMSTNSRFNWTTFSHSRLNIATLISVFPLWHRMMGWLCSRTRI